MFLQSPHVSRQPAPSRCSPTPSIGSQLALTDLLFPSAVSEVWTPDYFWPVDPAAPSHVFAAPLATLTQPVTGPRRPWALLRRSPAPACSDAPLQTLVPLEPARPWSSLLFETRTQQSEMSSTMTTPAAQQEKCYDPGDKTLKIVDEEDCLDFLCEGFKSPRAQMSCGHAVTPTSLTNWCLRQLDQGDSRFVCGQFGCGVEWPYVEVCKMALLTPGEKKHFERTLAFNEAKENFYIKACPGCKSYVRRMNESNLSVCCNQCTTKRGRTYEFCWQCLREWKGPQPRLDRCGNDGCCDQSLKTLQTCPDIVFECVEGITGCPSIRACPTCGSLLEHSTLNCKYVGCPRCKLKFCFVCLKQRHQCLTRSDHYMTCSSGVAPRQTSIPVWHRKNHTRPSVLK